MAEAEVEYNYKGKMVTIKCKRDEKLKDVCARYAQQEGLDINKIYWKFGDQDLNEELTFAEVYAMKDQKQEGQAQPEVPVSSTEVPVSSTEVPVTPPEVPVTPPEVPVTPPEVPVAPPQPPTQTEIPVPQPQVEVISSEVPVAPPQPPTQTEIPVPQPQVEVKAEITLTPPVVPVAPAQPEGESKSSGAYGKLVGTVAKGLGGN